MTPSNLSPADQQRLDGLYERLRSCNGRNVGYPTNQAFDCSDLFRFLEEILIHRCFVTLSKADDDCPYGCSLRCTEDPA